MEYILNVRSFFALLYKEVSGKYILRFPHHVYSSFVRFRITISVFCHCGAFPLIVIQSFGKNTL